MASPDITPYVDLTLYDKNPQEVFAAALALMQRRMPEWTPRETNTEVVVAEGVATEVAELVFAINRVPSAVVEVLLKMYEVDRDPGAPPVTTIRFNMSGTQGYTVPAGTSVLLELSEGLEPVVFMTDVELTVNPGSTFGVVAATGQTFTSLANGMVAGTDVEVIDSVYFVESAELDSTVVSGRDPETDPVYFERGTQRLSRLVDTLVLPRHFVTAALEYPYVIRATALDNYDPTGDPDNNGPVGSDGGHITVALRGDGANLTAPQKAEVLAFLESHSQTNLAVHIIDPTLNTVNVTATIVPDTGYTAAQASDNAEAALAEFLATSNWNWDTVVRRNALIQVIGNAEGVAYVNTITVPAADQTLTGVAPLTVPGTLTVT